MLFEIWARAQAKWRGILVYALLNIAARLVTDYIYHQSNSKGLRIFAALAGLATAIFCLVQTWRLLTKDIDGDQDWPPLWA